jgi:hypothetical protein
MSPVQICVEWHSASNPAPVSRTTTITPMGHRDMKRPKDGMWDDAGDGFAGCY